MYAFLSFLILLQIMMVMWFVVIVRIVLRMFRGERAEDLRSDSEDGESEMEIEGLENAQKLWEKSSDAAAVSSKSHANRKGMNGNSSGVSLASHRGRKEMLNRIGCEKQIE